jgi:translation initiation factor 2-alpha kinase 4
MREVKTLSRMQHRHILRYYQAWIEDCGDDDEDEGMLLEKEEGGEGGLNLEISSSQFDEITGQSSSLNLQGISDNINMDFSMNSKTITSNNLSSNNLSSPLKQHKDIKGTMILYI